MQSQIQNTKNEAIAQIMEASSLDELEKIRINYLGRSGKLAIFTKKMGSLEIEERKKAGPIINQTKNIILETIASQKNKLSESARTWFDATIPGERKESGHLHLVTKAIDEISDVFESVGFVRVRYPEVEWDWFAFESLNMSSDHPARDELETFFVNSKIHPKYGEMVLTPHTSSGQVREMSRVKTPPIRMINIAKCYRRQSDVAHYPMFHQFEGLVIDDDISIANLKGTLDHFAKNFFGPKRKTRIRPYNFLFTEPNKLLLI